MKRLRQVTVLPRPVLLTVLLRPLLVGRRVMAQLMPALL
jgi:hypothetical protein